MTLTFILSKTRQFFSGFSKNQILDLLMKLQKAFKDLDARYEALKQEKLNLKLNFKKRK